MEVSIHGCKVLVVQVHLDLKLSDDVFLTLQLPNTLFGHFLEHAHEPQGLFLGHEHVPKGSLAQLVAQLKVLQ